MLNSHLVRFVRRRIAVKNTRKSRSKLYTNKYKTCHVKMHLFKRPFHRAFVTLARGNVSKANSCKQMQNVPANAATLKRGIRARCVRCRKTETTRLHHSFSAQRRTKMMAQRKNCPNAIRVNKLTIDVQRASIEFNEMLARISRMNKCILHNYYN